MRVTVRPERILWVLIGAMGFEMLGSTLAIYAFLTFLRGVSPENSLLLLGGRTATNRHPS